jgi:hypothetical protein
MTIHELKYIALDEFLHHMQNDCVLKAIQEALTASGNNTNCALSWLIKSGYELGGWGIYKYKGESIQMFGSYTTGKLLAWLPSNKYTNREDAADVVITWKEIIEYVKNDLKQEPEQLSLGLL